MKKVRVLVVDDSAFMRKLISDFLNASSLIEVAGTARNGEDALLKAAELEPDVITLDIEMPVMDGLETLAKLKAFFNKPVIMLSSVTHKNAASTVLALEQGAFDFIAKPSGSISLDLYKVKDELTDKILAASRLTNQVIIQQAPEKFSMSVMKDKKPLDTAGKIVCIGTSTGGPRALQQVLSSLPPSISAPVFIVQHMPEGFTKSLADRLHSLSSIRVKEAEHNEIPQNGTAYIAPGGQHMRVVLDGDQLRILLDRDPPCNGHRPSVDILFQSIAELKGYIPVPVIMTGMGTDGTSGLQKIKQSSPAKAIAESKETAIVYGMPKSVIAAQLADSIVGLDSIADQILDYL
ncbi:chemotaxis-specific protein-glutamate methyltransferase CheB [Bacillus lacus]|uniref:Protein-glutamate methylesterase/protein-glutamine glutaminase n=1 Tax=Metabacillus lacus TaxID=1983721 RepID=A0A7X2LXD4_9BACI|nr:chemotaxis response regulator protein-glutamate methylesterase [Metabacillus lacus]MRX70613.1 chemotaxis-specific protein-glutamate methyltransferase CheB [Metabacillus lacus]